MRVPLLWCVVWVLWSVGVLLPLRAEAAERRIALLVVNQEGWAKEPRLRYALKGDAEPLARELRALGFTVRVLVNKAAPTLRRVLSRLRQRPIDTFLFYYSGHADPKALHLGPRKDGVFTHRRFVKAFSAIRATRKFAIFDACFSGEIIRSFGSLQRYRRLLRRGRIKGVQRRSRIDISRLAFPNQGQEQGFRVITSSLRLSWELKDYKASVFTFHMLQGLRGKADLDRDGKISIDELFDYTSRAVKGVTGQKPQQLVVTKRAQPYAIAPAYRSRLRIGAQVGGELQVSVANFLWSHRKSRGTPLILSVVDGPGTVRLRRKQRCWEQRIRLPKGGEIKLGRKWRSLACRRMQARRSKGMIALPARVAARAPDGSPWSLAVWGGVGLLGAANTYSAFPSGGAHLRSEWLHLGVSAGHGISRGRSFSLSRAMLEVGAGLPISFVSRGWQQEIFLGALFGGGLIWQQRERESTLMNLQLGGGAYISGTWWIGSWGLRCSLLGGVIHTPTIGSHGLSPWIRLALAVAWQF